MGLARKNEGCRALETDANQILIGLVRKVTLSPKQNGVVGGLHLPFNLSQGGKDGVCCQKSRNPGAGRLLRASGPPCPSFTYGNTEAPGVAGRGSPLGNRAGNDDSCWVTCFLLLLWDLLWGCRGSTHSAFQVLGCQRGESAVGPGTHPSPRNSVTSVLIRWVGLPRKSLNNHKEGASGHL